MDASLAGQRLLLHLETSLFWHNLWTDCGRPHQGLVADIMRKTRARYHRAMRYVKKNKDDIVNKRIAEALSENRSRDFWGEIKRIRQKTAASGSSVDGFSNSSGIADLFADKFHELYTNVDYDKDELLDICNDLNVSLHDVDSNPVLSVTPTDVLCAIRSLNLGSLMVTPDLALIILLMLATN